MQGMAYSFRVVNSGLVTTLANHRLSDTKGVICEWWKKQKQKENKDLHFRCWPCCNGWRRSCLTDEVKKTSNFFFIRKALYISIELRFSPSYIEVQHPTSRLAALRRLQKEKATQSTMEMSFAFVCMLDLYNAVCSLHRLLM